MPFSNLGNLLGDINFWGGVAEGAGTEMLRQEDRKDKDIRELRKYGIERGLQISEENRDALRAAEAQVTEIAAMLSGDLSANSPEALEAAFYLIDREGGVAGASQVAARYAQQYDNFGISPITEMGLQPREGGDALTPTSIAQTFTKLKPLPDISQSPIGSRKTALDVIFGGESAEDIVGEEMLSMFGTQDTELSGLVAPTADPTNEQFIIGSNFTTEKGRLMALHEKHRQVPEQNRDDEWKSIDNLLNARISLLENATRDLMPETSRKGVKGALFAELTSAFGLKADFNLDGSYKDAGMHQNIYKKANEAVSRMTTLLLEAKNKRYKGVHPVTGEVYDPREFIEVFGAGQGYNIIKVIPDDGDPYITFREGDSIFTAEDMESEDWKSSVIIDSSSGVKTPPKIGNNNASTGGATGATSTTTVTTSTNSSSIPDTLIDGLDSNTPSVRVANAGAIMTIIKRNNPNASQAELESEFNRITGMDWSKASTK